MWRLRASPRFSQAWLLSPGLFPPSLLAAVLFCCVFMCISSGLSYLKFIQLIEFVNFMPSPILKHFRPFFLFKNIFQSHTLSPSGMAMIQILDLLLLSHRSLRLCSFFFSVYFSLRCLDLVNLVDLFSSSLILSCYLHSTIESTQPRLHFGYFIFVVPLFPSASFS